MSQEKDVIQIVLAVYDPAGTYSRYAGIVMTSIFSNTQSKVHVTILHDSTLSADNRRRFERTGERWKQSVSFVDVGERILRFGALLNNTVATVLTRGALFRLLSPELLSVPKVIYLDCDIVVNLDIADLWAVSMGNFSLAAARDQGIPYFSRNETLRRRIMRYASEEYFNSGVLLMNLQRIREKYDLAQDACNIFERYAHVISYADQDCLNILFAKDVLFVDERFNRVLWHDSDIDNSILHFVGTKPWRMLRKSRRDDLFWKTFSESEWSGQMNEVLLEVLNQSIESYGARDCAKLVLRRILLLLRLRFKSFCRGWTIIIRELAFQMKMKAGS
jgi:lipopolysaccharide biosynthesis glycosyltransferase